MKLVQIGSFTRKMKTLDEIRDLSNNLSFDRIYLVNSNNGQKVDYIPAKYLHDQPTYIYDLRRGAEVHKIARRKIQETIKPGMKLIDICNTIENKIVEIFGQNDLKCGIAFPTGVSINHIVCHDTANINDQRVFGINDICKIDFGTHVNGMIIDCAFSATFNPEYQNLIEASKEGTWKGIRMSRPDQLIYDMSVEIQETIESYECNINGKIYPIKAVRNLGGHSIEPYVIHAGQLILTVPSESTEYKSDRIKAQTQYAIETFASTGSGQLFQNLSRQSNHYMLNKDHVIDKVSTVSNLKFINNVYHWIKTNRSTLAFCPRWLAHMKGVGMALTDFSHKRKPPLVIEYPPLEDTNANSLVSHLEHTIYVHDDEHTEVLSTDEDY